MEPPLFGPIFDLLISPSVEGFGGVDDPQDPGGLTVCGICKRWDPTAPIWNEVARLQSIGALVTQGPTDALLMGRVRTYWLALFIRLGLDKLTDRSLTQALFGAYVNQGPKVIPWMQAAVGVPQDGLLGPNTLAAINAVASPRTAWLEFLASRITYYVATAKSIYLHDLVGRALQGI